MIIETVVRDYLAEHMSVNVYTEAEENMPEEYVVIERTGGGKADHVCNATIAIQSYSKSKYCACVLNEIVKDTMENIVELDTVSSCGLNSDYDYTKPNSKSYRYQAVFDLYY